MEQLIDTDIITDITSLELPQRLTLEQLIQQLSLHISYLAAHDFQKLITLLYRVDVSEARLRCLLHENKGADAGLIIATLVVERQLQKQQSRQQNRRRDDNIPEEERW